MSDLGHVSENNNQTVSWTTEIRFPTRANIFSRHSIHTEFGDFTFSYLPGIRCIGRKVRHTYHLSPSTAEVLE